MIRRKKVTSKAKTVLLVDDDGDLVEVQEILLTGLGYHVLTSLSAEAALEVLKQDVEIDLLLTDLGLPGMNGRELADVARTLRPNIPVLFVTGLADPRIIDVEALPPAMRLFVKPGPIEEFYAVLNAMMGGAPQE
jgi:CheY-like chemotaxis protein